MLYSGLVITYDKISLVELQERIQTDTRVMAKSRKGEGTGDCEATPRTLALSDTYNNIGYRAKANLDSDGLRFIFSEDGMLLSLKYHISVLVVGISHMRFPPMALCKTVTH